MTELDLDRLGDVWRQRPDPKEMEELQRAADAVSRRVRWGQRLDIVAALLVGGVVLFLAISSPRSEALVVAGGLILVLLVSQIRSRRFRQEELRSLTGMTEEMLDQSIARLQATLKRIRQQLLLIVPGLLFGLAMAAQIDDGFYHQLMPDPASGTILSVAALLLLALGGSWLFRTLRSVRQETARLVALRDAYRRERASTDAGDA